MSKLSEKDRQALLRLLDVVSESLKESVQK